jgi:hypothetical protein
MSAPRAALRKSTAKPAGGKSGQRRKGAGLVTAASAPAPDGEISAAALKLADDIGQALARGQSDLLSEDALQALMAAACRSYSAQVEAGRSFPPLAQRSLVTSTDVMVTASGLLKSANLAVFELGMWQSWTGR